MIKAILFDLDGVLVEAKEIHFEALNKALGEKYAISLEEHLSVYDGLKTNQKLDILTKEKSLPIEYHIRIWNDKQKYTEEMLRTLQSCPEIKSCVQSLKKDGYKLGVCSNSIKNTVTTVLTKLEILEYFDIVLSNEDVSNSKPYPEIYWKAMIELNVLPEETLIIEDSPYGLLAASRSNANIMRVVSPKDLSYIKISRQAGRGDMIPKWKDEKLNVLIPMAGAGSRFEKAGYTFPKPLIDVRGKPMIQWVIDNLNVEAKYIFIVQKSHFEKYNLKETINNFCPNNEIVQIDGITEGAACTTLLAKQYIDVDEPLIIANSDQFVEWNNEEFIYSCSTSDLDANILTFKSTHPKWSYAKLNDLGYVTEVAEKKPISDIATVGIYYWRKGSDYVKYTEQMIDKNIRVNNEFYVCPVFNEAIQDNKKVRTYNIDKMWGLGTPEDLEHFLKNYK
jgi:HAD superfamily hydrolase (TIGR01509 family)